MNIITAIPVIINVVKAVEEVMPESAGKDKLAAALVMLESLFGTVQDTLPQITKLIETTVVALNTLGVFKKK